MLAVRENCVPTWVAVTWAVGTAAPELSLTVPRIVPVATWAWAEVARSDVPRTAAAIALTRNRRYDVARLLTFILP